MGILKCFLHDILLFFYSLRIISREWPKRLILSFMGPLNLQFSARVLSDIFPSKWDICIQVFRMYWHVTFQVLIQSSRSLTAYCSVHGVQHMFFGGICHQEMVVVNGIVLQYTNNLTENIPHEVENHVSFTFLLIFDIEMGILQC